MLYAQLFLKECFKPSSNYIGIFQFIVGISIVWETACRILGIQMGTFVPFGYSAIANFASYLEPYYAFFGIGFPLLCLAYFINVRARLRDQWGVFEKLMSEGASLKEIQKGFTVSSLFLYLFEVVVAILVSAVLVVVNNMIFGYSDSPMTSLSALGFSGQSIVTFGMFGFIFLVVALQSVYVKTKTEKFVSGCDVAKVGA